MCLQKDPVTIAQGSRSCTQILQLGNALVPEPYIRLRNRLRVHIDALWYIKWQTKDVANDIYEAHMATCYVLPGILIYKRDHIRDL